MRTVLALVPHMLGSAPAQRVRIETWARRLEGAGWRVAFCPFEDAALREVIYEPGRWGSKVMRSATCYRRQWENLRNVGDYDVVFVAREAALLGPALLERVACRSDAPFIYDIDDPVFLPYRSPANGWASLLKFPGKTHTLFRLASHVTTVNETMAEYVRGHNPSVTVIPNSIDVERHRPAPTPPGGPIRLVWIGTPNTAGGLTAIAPALRRLTKECGTVLTVIGRGAPDLPGVDVDVRPWSLATEVRDLQDGHIGLVPVADWPWRHMKSSYKMLQYMAVGLPVVAHRIGATAQLVDEGVTGLLADSDDEWFERLRDLVVDADLRRRMGEQGRKKAIAEFSDEVVLDRVSAVFDQVAAAAIR